MQAITRGCARVYAAAGALPGTLAWWQRASTQQAAGFTSLPIVDVGPLVDSNAGRAAKLRVAQALHEACKDVGFFYVTNHGIPGAVTTGVLDEARQWFHLPERVKGEIGLSPARHYRGYQALGANVTRFEGGFQRDWHEGLDLFREVTPAEAQHLPPSPLHGPNQWPHQHPPFEALLRSYLHHCQQLGAGLLRGIALGLGLEEGFFARPQTAGMQGSYWIARVIHYPPLAQGSQQPGGGAIAAGAADAVRGSEVSREVQLSCGSHTDYGLLTLVNQEAGISALQVQNAAGAWVDAPPIPGTLVCNLGDMLKVWTNGLYMPTLHRVINAHPEQSRVSAPFFYEPAFAAEVAPLPQFVGPEGPRFAPVCYGRHLESKVLSNFELDPELVQQAAGA